MSSDDSSFHNFTVLVRNECRWAEVLVFGQCSDGVLGKDGDGDGV